MKAKSDATDREWEIAEAMPPKQGRLGRPRETALREVLGAIQYVLATGCQWRALPRDFSALFDGHQLFLQVASQRCF